MPRPKTKTTLLELSATNFKKLYDSINQLDKDQQLKDFKKGGLNRNIRDVLMHLHHWHLLLMGWYKIGVSGEKPDMPAKGYTWRTVPDLNKWIWEKYQDVKLDTAKRKCRNSHKQLMAIIESHSNEELFEKKKYKWTGSTSMGAYLVSATSSHYDWAIKLIKKSQVD